MIQPNEKVMVVLDSDHSKDHVFKELNIYSKLVTKGNYLIVEDTNVDHFGLWTGQTKGPGEAVREFLQTTNEFVPDKGREKFLLTFNPGGYLRKVR
jgi:cephalosporin hydroxylase